MREIIKMIVVLSCICGVAGAALAFLKDGTVVKIEEQVLTFVQGPAIKKVFTDYDNDPIMDRKKFDIPGSDAKVTVFPYMKGGKLVAVAMEDFGGGFGDDIGVMVGFDAAGDKLVGIGITTSKETPGVGTRVAEPGFTKQFKGHATAGVELSSKGGDISGVSGATFSSIGSVIAVQNAVKKYDALKQEIQGAW
ncbi:MAG: FMN-binding protein [Thermodesulfobacteriota bacterium]|nr:FMN-binding protein [Thermodesulfobacteriota bacterium]